MRREKEKHYYQLLSSTKDFFVPLTFPKIALFGKVIMISPPTKPKNKERRSREFLSSGEIDKLIKTARDIGRYGHRTQP